MIPIEIATAQITRLGSTGDYHLKSPEAIHEYVKTLMYYAANENHAERGISQWLTEQRLMPTVADLVDMLNATRLGEPKNSQYCRFCGGTGFIQAYELCTPTVDGLLRQPLHGGFYEAQKIMDDWRAEDRAWCAAHLGEMLPRHKAEYIGDSAHRCVCNPAKAA